MCLQGRQCSAHPCNLTGLQSHLSAQASSSGAVISFSQFTPINCQLIQGEVEVYEGKKMPQDIGYLVCDPQECACLTLPPEHTHNTT